MQQRRARHVAEINFAPAAVDEHADGDRDATVLFHDVDDFFDRAAGRDDVFDDEAALARVQREAAAECHLAVLALCEDRARAERLACLMGEQDAARDGADDGLDVRVFEFFSHGLAELLRVLWVLQDVEFLDVVRAVEAARQEEMAIHNRVCFDQKFLDFCFCHWHGDFTLLVLSSM